MKTPAVDQIIVYMVTCLNRAKLLLLLLVAHSSAWKIKSAMKWITTMKNATIIVLIIKPFLRPKLLGSASRTQMDSELEGLDLSSRRPF